MTRANGVLLDEIGGRELYRLEKDLEVEILRVQDGYYEVRLNSGQRGWISEAFIIAALVAEPGVNHQEVGATVCAEFSSARDRVVSFRKSDDVASVVPPGFAGALRGRTVQMRFSLERQVVAESIAARLEKFGATIVATQTDSTATAICGNDVYYDTKDLSTALSARSAVADLVDLNTTSLKQSQRMVMWIK
jgi:hypothetical protein